MKTFAFLSKKRTVAAALLLATLLVGGIACADDGDFWDWWGSSVVRIEEDWSLQVNSPDTGRSSPQVSTQMARIPNAIRFCNFHLNSRDVPTYQQGGLQLQVWQGTTNTAVLTMQSNVMSAANELVTWTQYLRKDGSSLKFGISDASSTTWGDFSGQEVTVPGSSTNLGNYSSDYSVNHSGVTYGANRVTCMVLTAVRVYFSNGYVWSDNTPKVIYSTTLDPSLSGDGTN